MALDLKLLEKKVDDALALITDDELKQWLAEKLEQEKSAEAGGQFERLVMPQRELLIHFLEGLRAYERESHNLIGFDERESEEFVNIYLERVNNHLSA